MAEARGEKSEPLYGVTLSDIPAEDLARAKSLRRRIVIIAVIVAFLAAVAVAVTVIAVRGESRSALGSVNANAVAWCASIIHRALGAAGL